MRCLIIFVCLFFGIVDAATYERITNYSSSRSVYDVDFTENTVWVATSGGLFRYSTTSTENYFRPSNASFPDPVIRALTVDSKGNLWAASNDGYLMRVDKNRNEYINKSYNSAGWKITDIYSYGSYLIVASDKGISLFDTEKNIAVKNALQIGTFKSSWVNAITIYKKRLYLGCASGLAFMKEAVDNISDVNFYNPSIWAIDSTVNFPVYSFLPDSGKLKTFKGPSARFNGTVITGDSATCTVHTTKNPYTIKLPSIVTSINVLNGNKCWIGTSDNYFYIWDIDTFYNVHLGGPTFTGANKLLVDRSGKLWVLPFGLSQDINRYIHYNPALAEGYWWLGINTLDKSGWKKYGPGQYPQMGHMGLSIDANGILEATDGSFWFGYSGGSLKRYLPETDQWYQYCIFGEDEGNGAFLKTQKGVCPQTDWGKCDAVAQDSSGYIWIASWNNYNGCLICYKPDPNEDDSLTGRYRRHPPNGYGKNEVGITSIEADKSGNILYGTIKGELTVISYTGDPTRNSVSVVKHFPNLSKILDIVVIPDGTSLIATNEGVYQYNPFKMTLTLMKEFDRNIVKIVVENESVYWYGTSDEGIVRHDLQNDEKTYFNKSNGLISNQVRDIIIDKTNGYVWVASDQGISSLALGYTSSSNKKNGVMAFPNPFSRKLHKRMYFQNVPSGATLRIYSLSGTLVGKPDLVRNSDDGSYFQWQPSAGLSPGTYFYTVAASKNSSRAKIILVP